MEVTARRALAKDRQIWERNRVPAVREWWFHRRRVLEEKTGRVEARAFTNLMYTDDGAFACVGIASCRNLLREWTDTCSEAGLIMAIPAKRQIGTMVVSVSGLQADMIIIWMTVSLGSIKYRSNAAEKVTIIQQLLRKLVALC